MRPPRQVVDWNAVVIDMIAALPKLAMMTKTTLSHLEKHEALSEVRKSMVTNLILRAKEEEVEILKNRIRGA